MTKKAPYKGPSADSEEKHEPVSDIDTAAADSLKVLDPKRPIREADIVQHRGNVRFVPGSDICTAKERVLFDHVVGGYKKGLRHREAERLGGLEVEHELEFGGLHNRQVGRLLALENSSDVDANLTVGLRNAGRVAHQTTGHDVFALGIASRQRMASRHRNEAFPMG